MSSMYLRILIALAALALAAGLGFGAGPVLRWAQRLSSDYSGGFVVIVGLMTLLALISIFRMPLTAAGRPRRRHR